jgi:hypothetical protein
MHYLLFGFTDETSPYYDGYEKYGAESFVTACASLSEAMAARETHGLDEAHIATFDGTRMVVVAIWGRVLKPVDDPEAWLAEEQARIDEAARQFAERMRAKDETWYWSPPLPTKAQLPTMPGWVAVLESDG